MDKRIAFFLTVALAFGLAPVASASAAPAPPESCSVLNGNFTFKPPLPTEQSHTSVKPTLTFTAKVSHCAGPVKGTGVVTFTKKMTIGINCGSQNPKWIPVKEHIKWSDGKTSAVSSLVPFSVPNDSFNGPVTAGAFRRHHQVTRLRGSSAPGSCINKPLASENLKLVKNVKFVMK